MTIATKNRIKRTTGVGVGSVPFTYLGCLIFYGRKKVSNFEDLVKKISRRVMTWHSKLLTYGGKYVLICNVLQSMPIYLMSAMNPLKGVIDQIHKVMANFFLGGQYWWTKREALGGSMYTKGRRGNWIPIITRSC